MSIKNNLEQIKKMLPENVTLVAISKTKSVDEIMEAYNAGHRDFGENKIQEMEEKWHKLPKDISWHMVGHVQRNKVKDMAPFVNLIHGVDRLRLLREIDKEANKNDRVIDCLLQIKIAEEDTKFGMTAQDAKDLLISDDVKSFKNIRIVGLMGMATFTDDNEQISKEFSKLESLYDELKDPHQLTILSMGMSGDYDIALKHGSNMVRVGSAIFAERNY